jgi:hypothetical protein
MPSWRPAAAFALAVALLSAVPCPAPSCSLCNNLQAATIREEAAQSGARLILAGTLENPRLSASGAGLTDLRITDVLRTDDWLAGRKVVELPRYLAVSDAKNPPRFIVFCDLLKDRLDPYRGIPILRAESVEYVKKALALDPKDRAANLPFFFNYLENPDPEVASDAFLEFAKASDAELSRVGPKLSAAKLHAWLENPRTDPRRLGLYAVLLGACGGPADAKLLEAMLKDGAERSTNAYDGLLAGYIHLRPREGWELAMATLGSKNSLQTKLGVLRTLRFYQAARPADCRVQILQAEGIVLRQADLADMAIEDLRRWKLWDLTPTVLACYGTKGYEAPIMQRAIVRYALSCQDREDAGRFVATLRKSSLDLVQEVEESLQFEKAK